MRKNFIVPKDTNFLDMLAANLSYLKSAEVFISNTLAMRLLKSCSEVRHENGLYLLIWKTPNLQYDQSILVCLNSSYKWKSVSEINIQNQAFLSVRHKPKYKLYFK